MGGKNSGRLFGSFKIGSEQELREKIEKYLTRNDDTDGVLEANAWNGGRFLPTVSGLARALGVNRRTLVNYKDNEEYSHLIHMFLSIIEENLERGLYGQAVTGLIFNLKNNFGWKDKSEVEQSTKVVDDGEDEF